MSKKLGDLIMTIGIIMMLLPIFLGVIGVLIYLISLVSWSKELLYVCAFGVYMLISIILTLIGLTIYNK